MIPNQSQVDNSGVVLPVQSSRRDASWVRIAYEHVVFWGALAVLVSTGLGLTLFAQVARAALPKRLSARLGQGFLFHFFGGYFRALQASGLFRFELAALDLLRDEAPLVIVSNHPALLDAMLVASRLPNVVGIMKADVRLNPVFGGGALLAGYCRGDRPLEMVHAMVEATRDGQHVLVFPESTRTVQRPVNPFKGNFALIAKQAQVPVQTLILETDSAFLGKGWPLARKPPMPVCFRARLGKRFAPSEDAKTLLRDVEAYFHAELGAGPQR